MLGTSIRRRLTVLLAAAATAAAGIVAVGPAAEGAKPVKPSKQYVALGDSYSSGTGTGSYIADGTSCQRSVYAYPSLDAAALGLSLNFRACSGATVADVTSAQLGALSDTTGYVTISVGGNDAGFADVVSTCAGSDTTACLTEISAANAFITGTLPGELNTLYGSIKTAAPNARFIVVGYPRLFNGQDCSLWTSFTGEEMTQLNATADTLNGVIATAAGAVGATVADPTTIFGGHAVCDSSPWINNVNLFSLSESFHPNRTGHASGYAVLTQPLFGVSSGGKGGKGKTAAEVRAIAEASAGQLARDAARYAEVDRSITPETFSLTN